MDYIDITTRISAEFTKAHLKDFTKVLKKNGNEYNDIETEIAEKDGTTYFANRHLFASVPACVSIVKETDRGRCHLSTFESLKTAAFRDCIIPARFNGDYTTICGKKAVVLHSDKRDAYLNADYYKMFEGCNVFISEKCGATLFTFDDTFVGIVMEIRKV